MNTDPFVVNPLLASIRKEFEKSELKEDTVNKDPFLQFGEWLQSAFAGGNELANAMVLSTVGKDMMPSSRVMLLRDISYGGFTFFTNYDSRKGAEIRENDKASLLFFWPDMERQVRIEGTLSLLPEKESDAYFQSRPFESRVGALVSKQSTVVAGRTGLEADYAAELLKYQDHAVPRPANWGGYVLRPVAFEFWQGRANRLHDRIRYRPDEKNSWIIERLMP